MNDDAEPDPFELVLWLVEHQLKPEERLALLGLLLEEWLDAPAAEALGEALADAVLPTIAEGLQPLFERIRHRNPKPRKRERDAEILALRAADPPRSWGALGKKYGLTRGGVRAAHDAEKARRAAGEACGE